MIGSGVEKEERMISAYAYLKGKGLAHTQQDVARKMGADSATVSRAFKGNPNALTNSFLKRFNEAYGNLFNLQWLQKGEGEMLTSTEDPYGQRHLNSAHVLNFICTREQLTPTQVCERLGIDGQADIENGVRGFSREELIALNREFPHYELQFLMTGTGEPLRPQSAPTADGKVLQELTDIIRQQAEQISQLTTAVLNLSAK